MKTLKLIVFAVGAIMMAFTFQSCLDDDGYSLDKFSVSVATVESDDSSSHYFRLDNDETLIPVAGWYTGHNLMDGQRTLLNYTLLSDSIYNHSHAIKVNGVDPILTKKIAENLGAANDSVYGKDPVSIKSIWIGGGYLNILFTANYGGYKKHFVNLLQTDAASDPYRLEFRHNAYNDPPATGAQGIVCFDLSDLPETTGETVKMTVQVYAFGGTKTYELDFNSAKKGEPDKAPSDLNMDYYEKVN